MQHQLQEQVEAVEAVLDHLLQLGRLVVQEEQAVVVQEHLHQGVVIQLLEQQILVVAVVEVQLLMELLVAQVDQV